jgi:hypothetical protein
MNSRRLAIIVILTYLAWSATFAQYFHVSYHRHIPLGRSIAMGIFVGLAILGLFALGRAVWCLIFGQYVPEWEAEFRNFRPKFKEPEVKP